MSIPRDQVIHDLAMACVHGAIQIKVLEESKENVPVITASDLAIEATMTYRDAYSDIALHFEAAEAIDS